MKRFEFWSLVLILALVIGSSSFAMGGPAPSQPKTAGAAPATSQLSNTFLIDDFESGNIKSPREWWTFDITEAKAVSNDNCKGGDPEVEKAAMKYSLLLKGKAKSWYAGGVGTYLAKENQDLSKYNYFVVDIYGNGPGSGTLKIELADDDNGNWQYEQDPAKNYAPMYDDKFVNEIRVDWSGWKRVELALADFVDDNPGVGDDIWNPQQTNGSAGLLQVQFICVGNKDNADINFNIDNVALTK